MAEQRKFRVDPNLIFDVISKQAGTCSKAALEAVMNSIDSGSTRCEVTFSSEGYTVSDDGRGFGDRQSVEDFFEVFGKPHQKGDAVMGRFRIGRGQGFSFGVNHWRSGIFTMIVDLKNRGLDYTLLESPEDERKGCVVDVRFYSPLSPNDLDQALRDLKEMVAYCPIPVVINGEVMSKDRRKTRWDHEDEDCLISFNANSSTLKVYNLGIFVRAYRAGQFGGAGGVVVSKRQLEVNFARNDVLTSACDVWKRIRKELDRLGRERSGKQRQRITADDREFALGSFLHGDTELRDFMSEKMFPLFPTGYVSLRTLLDRCASTHRPERRIPLVVLDHGDSERLAEAVHREGRAMVLRGQILDWCNADTAQQLVAGLESAIRRKDPYCRYLGEQGILLSSLDAVGEGIRGNVQTLPTKEWTPLETAVMNSLIDCLRPLVSAVIAVTDGDTDRIVYRHPRIGLSDTALAWTDGSTYICYDRKFVQKCIQSLAGVQELLCTTVHEYLHDTEDAGSHVHDADFYARFHEAVLGGALQATPLFLQRLTQSCNKTRARLPYGLRNDLNRIFKLGQARTEEGVDEDADPAGAAMSAA